MPLEDLNSAAFEIFPTEVVDAFLAAKDQRWEDLKIFKAGPHFARIETQEDLDTFDGQSIRVQLGLALPSVHGQEMSRDEIIALQSGSSLISLLAIRRYGGISAAVQHLAAGLAEEEKRLRKAEKDRGAK